MSTSSIASAARGSTSAEAVTIPPAGLEGILHRPELGRGIVLFAHGSGSGRKSPRNNFVAGELRKADLGTLLFDLLTPREAASRENIFDIDLLAHRLVQATEWLAEREDTRRSPIGYFGASTGAAAALVAATQTSVPVAAIVSRGGRPDLAAPVLGRVRASTLLIVGGEDRDVLELNRQALAHLPNTIEKDLVVVPGAGHLFEEPGALDAVVDEARRWFLEHVTP